METSKHSAFLRCWWFGEVDWSQSCQSAESSALQDTHNGQHCNMNTSGCQRATDDSSYRRAKECEPSTNFIGNRSCSDSTNSGTEEEKRVDCSQDMIGVCFFRTCQGQFEVFVEAFLTNTGWKRSKAEAICKWTKCNDKANANLFHG